MGLFNLEGRYHNLGLINGGKKSISNYGYGSLIAYCPINHYQYEPNSVECDYRVKNMIESMLLSIDMVQENDLKRNSFKIVLGLKELFNKKAKNIPSRILLICEDGIGNKLNKND